MNEGLKALEEFRKDNTYGARLFSYSNLDIVESELKDKEKKDKALEIIKRTRLNVGAFMILCKGNHEHTPNTTYEQYVYFCEHEDDIGGDEMHSFPCYRMTKEEYELVLGVLYGKETS